MLPSVVIIGAGNLAYHLALNIHQSKIPLLQVCNRSRRGLAYIRKNTGVETTSSLKKINREADIYIIAVSDDAIRETALAVVHLIPVGAVMAHTSGSVSIVALNDIGVKLSYGSFYPLQSFKKERAIDFSKVPIFLSSNSRDTIKKLSVVAHEISNKVVVIQDDNRSKLHIPAVYVNNFVNHMYTVAMDYCSKENLQLAYLHPLMKETLERILDDNKPQDMQTGPAIRGDRETIENHRKLLKDHPDQLPLYNYLTKAITRYYNENN